MQPIKKLLSLLLVMLALPLLAFIWISVRENLASRKASPIIKLGAGREGEQRYEMARVLQTLALAKGVRIELSAEKSVDADELKKVSEGKLAAAIIHGGMDFAPNVDQAAAIITEPLHLLVRPNLAQGSLLGLKDQKFELGPEGSGVRRLAEKVLGFAKASLGSKTAFTQHLNDHDIEPDVKFVLCSLPSAEVTQYIESGVYTLMELPMAKAMALYHRDIQESEIPAFTYQYNPAIPEKAMKTVGTRLLFVVNKNVPDDQVYKILESLYEGDFARRINRPQLDEGELSRDPEYPISPATFKFAKRNMSIFTSDNIQMIDSLHNIIIGALAALAFGLACLARVIWPGTFAYRLKQADALRRRFERVQAVSVGSPPMDELGAIGDQLRQLRCDISTEYAHGRLRRKEQFDRIVAYVYDLEKQVTDLVSRLSYTVES